MKKEELENQLNSIYHHVNNLILWKTSLKVKINNKIPAESAALIGVEGYISDVNADGFLVWDKANDNFYRVPSDYLDIVEWDRPHFAEVLKKI